MPKVVVTDYSFPALEVEEAILEPLGVELVGQKCKTPEELIALVADADCVITQFAPLKAPVVAAMNKARAIVRYGIGVDNVDLAAARERGIPVCNVPDYCIDEVADQTLAFVLALTRSVVPNCTLLRGGKWGLGVPLEGMRNLRDMTVGVVGLGRIGREVVRRLLAFKCQVLAFDPALPPAEIAKLGCKSAPLQDVINGCDLLTLHCPSTPDTRKMINAQSLASMKHGVLLVNVSRGDLVDTPALVAALQSGQVAAAALDVFDPEPLPTDHPLLKMDNVVVAAHIASTSVKAVRTLRESVAKIAAAAVQGQPLPNIVNGVAQQPGRPL